MYRVGKACEGVVHPVSIIHAVEKSTSNSGLQNVFGMVFLLSGMEKCIIGGTGDPEAKSYIFFFL